MTSVKKKIIRDSTKAITGIIIALFIFVFIGHSHAETQIDKTNLIASTQDNRTFDKEIDRLIQNYDETKKQIRDLDVIVKLQETTIRNISQQLVNIENSKSSGFEVWTGILLACVSVIVTVLGVGVALLSLVGYKEIVSKGTEKAAVAASKQAEIEFQKFISDGRLNDVIAEGINKISLRGIPSGKELEEDTEQEQKSDQKS